MNTPVGERRSAADLAACDEQERRSDAPANRLVAQNSSFPAVPQAICDIAQRFVQVRKNFFDITYGKPS